MNEKNFTPEKQTEAAILYGKDPLSNKDTWDSMSNDIERYQQIKNIVLKMFELFKNHVPDQVLLVLENEITKLTNEFPTDEQELRNFFELAKVFSDQLAQSMDNEDYPELATPHGLATTLDQMIHGFDEYIDQELFTELGQKLLACSYELANRFKKSDWQKGWN